VIEAYPSPEEKKEWVAWIEYRPAVKSTGWHFLKI